MILIHIDPVPTNTESYSVNVSSTSIDLCDGKNIGLDAAGFPGMPESLPAPPIDVFQPSSPEDENSSFTITSPVELLPMPKAAHTRKKRKSKRQHRKPHRGKPLNILDSLASKQAKHFPCLCGAIGSFRLLTGQTLANIQNNSNRGVGVKWTYDPDPDPDPVPTNTESYSVNVSSTSINLCDGRRIGLDAAGFPGMPESLPAQPIDVFQPSSPEDANSSFTIISPVELLPMPKAAHTRQKRKSKSCNCYFNQFTIQEAVGCNES
ncbi:unnamed protein product [Clavelina lepadiformis]|uniref:Uncharacterized protein n=1 Tax=Clavelina lepadiformis TaxID=159417 RepID=A0ABP0GPX5_CLALP